MAVRLTPNAYGNYNVVSAYLVEQKDIDSRRAAGRLKIVVPKG